MLLLDLGLSLLLTTTIAVVARLEPSVWLITTGIAGSLLPDWDMLPHLIRKRGKLDQWTHKHRDLSHYPLITVPMGSLAVGHLFGLWYGIIVAVTTTTHYVTDSFEVGWGVRWLYPFSNRYFSYRSVGSEGKQLCAWTPAEQDEVAIQLGNPNWAKEWRRWQRDLLVLGLGIGVVAYWYLNM